MAERPEMGADEETGLGIGDVCGKVSAMMGIKRRGGGVGKFSDLFLLEMSNDWLRTLWGGCGETRSRSFPAVE